MNVWEGKAMALMTWAMKLVWCLSSTTQANLLQVFSNANGWWWCRRCEWIPLWRLWPWYRAVPVHQCWVLERVWSPDKIGTVKLTQAVTLLPKHEHLVWGRCWWWLWNRLTKQSHWKGTVNCWWVSLCGNWGFGCFPGHRSCFCETTTRCRGTKFWHRFWCVIQCLSCCSFGQKSVGVGAEWYNISSCQVSAACHSQLTHLTAYQDVFSRHSRRHCRRWRRRSGS